jgi:hypothetical protein
LRIYNKLLVSLAISFGVVSVILASFGQDEISIYLIAYAIAYLAVILFYVSLNPKARAAVNKLGTNISIGFIVVLILKLFSILK